MIKDSTKVVCDTCGQNVAFVKVIKPWSDPNLKDDVPFKGMVRRCKCGTFDGEGKDIKKLVG